MCCRKLPSFVNLGEAFPSRLRRSLQLAAMEAMPGVRKLLSSMWTGEERKGAPRQPIAQFGQP